MYGSKYQMWRIPRYAGLKSNNLKKLNDHSFFGNPFYHWISGHHKKFLVLFAQDLIVNCLSSYHLTHRNCRDLGENYQVSLPTATKRPVKRHQRRIYGLRLHAGAEKFQEFAHPLRPLPFLSSR